MCPHWAPGATKLQHPFYLAISDVPGPLWALWATTWTTSISIHFRRLMSPMSPESPFIPMSYTSSHYMNQVKIYPFLDVLCPHWALGATSCQCHIHIAVRCTMCPHWAPGATRPQCPLHLAISDVLGPLWAIGATIWTTPRSTHFQTIYVPNEPWEPLHINVIYIWSLDALWEHREPPGFNTLYI